MYDDRLVFTYNFKDGTETITLEDVEAALGSDLTQVPPPDRSLRASTVLRDLLFVPEYLFCPFAVKIGICFNLIVCLAVIRLFISVIILAVPRLCFVLLMCDLWYI